MVSEEQIKMYADEFKETCLSFFHSHLCLVVEAELAIFGLSLQCREIAILPAKTIDPRQSLALAAPA